MTGSRGSTASSNEIRAALAARLRERLQELEQAVATRVYAISDPREVADPGYLQGLKEAVAAAIEYRLGVLEAGERRAPDVPTTLLAQARLDARDECRWTRCYGGLSPGMPSSATSWPAYWSNLTASSSSTQLDRERISVSPVQVTLGSLAAQALAASDDPDPERLSLLLPRAVRFYFEERDGGQPGWRCPSFLDRGARSKDGREVNLPDELWQQLQAEAELQEVSPEDLLQHATFYYAAARDEGRLTQRIVEELQREEGGR